MVRLYHLSIAPIAALALLLFLRTNARAADSRLYPDRSLTPGVVYKVSESDVCSRGYSRRTRHVTNETKREVFQRYHVKYFPHAYEVDHFFPLCLGGSNDVKNLWPEPIQDALEKDKVEDYLCREVCEGGIQLAAAREKIRTDWKKVFEEEVKPNLRYRTKTK